MRWPGKASLRFMRGQKGFLLIDVLVGLALLGIITVAFLSGLFTTSKGVMISQESVAAESLAKSQIEHIKAQPYIRLEVYDPDYPDDPQKCYPKIDIPADLVGEYDIEIEINPPEFPVGEGPFELQIITVVIKRNGNGVFTISIYREGTST